MQSWWKMLLRVVGGMALCLVLCVVASCSSDSGNNNASTDGGSSLPDDDVTPTGFTDPDILGCLERLPEVSKLSSMTDLPPLLKTYCDSKDVKTLDDWKHRRRPEILGLFEHYVYGVAPKAPTSMKVELAKASEKALDGAASRKIYRIQADDGSPPIELLVYIPTAKKPAPVFLGLNFFGNHTVLNDKGIPINKGWIPARAEGVKDNKATEESRGTYVERWSIAQNIKAGFAVATLYHGDLDVDQPDGKNWVHERFGANEAIRKKPESGGTISAWAWGLSRAVDALLKDSDINGKQIWVMGHSRNGKAALLAAARDLRIAGVISNQSGSMGAAVNRGKQGETIKTIQPFFPHWFNDVFAGFVEEPNLLPVDQHLFLALIAPRPLLVSTATGDEWADPPSAWRSVVAAQPAWALYGKEQPKLGEYPKEGASIGKDIAFHRRPGIHSVIPSDWMLFASFASQY